METKLENRKVAKLEPPVPAGAKVNPQPHIKRIGQHDHVWQFYAIGIDGARYETCGLCNARRVVDRSVLSAMHSDWIDGVGDWDPAEDKLNPPAAKPDKSEEAKILAENTAADEKAAKLAEEKVARDHPDWVKGKAADAAAEDKAKQDEAAAKTPGLKPRV